MFGGPTYICATFRSHKFMQWWYNVATLSDKLANSSLLSPGHRISGDASQPGKCCKGLNIDNLAISAQGMAFWNKIIDFFYTKNNDIDFTLYT